MSTPLSGISALSAGKYCFLAFFQQASSICFIISFSNTGVVFHKLKISYVVSCSSAFMVQSTISSIYVKFLKVFPLLYTSMVFSSNIPLVKIKNAPSGLHHGPYTLKYLRPTVGSQK
jgi:hypothetical protein